MLVISCLKGRDGLTDFPFRVLTTETHYSNEADDCQRTNSDTKLQLHLTKVTNRVLAANVTASHSVWYVGVT